MSDKSSMFFRKPVFPNISSFADLDILPQLVINVLGLNPSSNKVPSGFLTPSLNSIEEANSFLSSGFKVFTIFYRLNIRKIFRNHT